jgi:hypothetical protein
MRIAEPTFFSLTQMVADVTRIIADLTDGNLRESALDSR